MRVLPFNGKLRACTIFIASRRFLFSIDPENHCITRSQYHAYSTGTTGGMCPPPPLVARGALYPLHNSIGDILIGRACQSAPSFVNWPLDEKICLYPVETCGNVENKLTHENWPHFLTFPCLFCGYKYTPVYFVCMGSGVHNAKAEECRNIKIKIGGAGCIGIGILTTIALRSVGSSGMAAGN